MDTDACRDPTQYELASKRRGRGPRPANLSTREGDWWTAGFWPKSHYDKSGSFVSTWWSSAQAVATSQGQADDALPWPREGVITSVSTAASAHYVAGIRLERTGDLEGALVHFREAAGDGYTPAWNKLGVMHETGCGVGQDMDAALAYYMRAASRGHAAAKFNLGSFYRRTGEPARAVECYESASDRGHVRATKVLAIIFYRGDGVPIDRSRASFFLTRARRLEPT